MLAPTHFLVVIFFPLENLVDVDVFLTAPPFPTPPKELLVVNVENCELPFVPNISSNSFPIPKPPNPANGLNTEATCVWCPLRDPRELKLPAKKNIHSWQTFKFEYTLFLNWRNPPLPLRKYQYVDGLEWKTFVFFLLLTKNEFSTIFPEAYSQPVEITKIAREKSKFHLFFFSPSKIEVTWKGRGIGSGLRIQWNFFLVHFFSQTKQK